MKVVFLSNYFNHHQQFFSDAMYRIIGDGYSFIETSKMRAERRKLGYGIEIKPTYVKQSFNNPDGLSECIDLVNNADVVIVGSAPERFLKDRKKNNKLIFRYQERIFKQDLNLTQKIKRGIAWYIRNFKKENIYLLCASAYTVADYKRLGLFEKKAYKWGYFPNHKTYDIVSLIDKKEKNKILWCGRFLQWKHPEYALYVADRLKKDGYNFSIDFIGTGELEETLKNETEKLGIENNVNFLGTMKPDEVREHMEKSAIFMFTSNFGEGWGVVLNEAMNSGCAVVASHAIGSVPFLLKNNENGLIFKNENADDLYFKIKYLLDNPQKQKQFGLNAYNTISESWNPNVAAERFLKLVETIQKGEQNDLFFDGPCSRANILINDWSTGAE